MRTDDETDTRWDRLVEPLGAPDDPAALRRARELAADGWELLGVQFGRGEWLFRRLREQERGQPPDQT